MSTLSLTLKAVTEIASLAAVSRRCLPVLLGLAAVVCPGVAALPILSYSGETRSNVIKINGQPNPILADSYLYP